jgi:hypothetical protein
VLKKKIGDENVPAPRDMTEAFWQACYGAQREAAEFLLERGAELNWVGWNERTVLIFLSGLILMILLSGYVIEWLDWLAN